jgi:hypothetical protein
VLAGGRSGGVAGLGIVLGGCGVADRVRGLSLGGSFVGFVPAGRWRVGGFSMVTAGRLGFSTSGGTEAGGGAGGASCCWSCGRAVDAVKTIEVANIVEPSQRDRCEPEEITLRMKIDTARISPFQRRLVRYAIGLGDLKLVEGSQSANAIREKIKNQ